MARGLSFREAIDAKCKECIYDPESRGTWREQVKECSSSLCPLHPLRPLPIEDTKARAASAKAEKAVSTDVTP